MNPKYIYVDAICGAGKTEAAIEYAISEARSGKSTLILQPTKDLINQTANRINEHQTQNKKFNSREIPVIKIYGDAKLKIKPTVELRAAVEKYKSLNRVPVIILSTTQAFMQMPVHMTKIYRKLNVIIDESIKADSMTSVTSSDKEFNDLLDGLDIINTTGSRFLEVKFSDDPEKCQHRKSIESRIGKRQRKTNDPLYHLAKPLMDNHKKVFLEKTFIEKISKPSGEVVECNVFAITKPSILSGFSEVILMEAMFTDSLTCKIWKKEGVDFLPAKHKAFQSMKQKHDNGHLLTIHYAFNGNWSKNAKKKTTDDGDTVTERYQTAVNQLIEDKPCLYLANRDDVLGKNLVLNSPDSERLSGTPHGMNAFQHFGVFVNFGAFNLKPAHQQFLEFIYGISNDEVRTDMYYQKTYQALMRTSLRNPDSKEPVLAIIPDKSCAEYIAGHFSGCAIQRIDGLSNVVIQNNPGRKPAPYDAKKMAHVREAAKRKRVRHLKKLKDKPFAFTQFKDEYSRWDEAVVTHYDSFNDIAEILKSHHHQQPQPKELKGFPLYTGAIFNGGKGADNVEHTRLLILDFDTGNLPHEEFSNIFSEYEFLITNTRSGTGRYRVIFPLQQAIDNEVYRFLMESIRHLITKAGFDIDDSGLDKTKGNASDMFYYPCQAATGGQDTFFYRNPGEQLNPIAWVSKPKFKEIIVENQSAAPINFCPNQSADNLVDEYRLIEPNKIDGLRNKKLYWLACQLRKLGLPANDIEYHLNVANFDKRHDVKALMKKFR